jgi:hypothetical protein
MSIEMNRHAFLRAFHDLQLPTAIQHKAIGAKRGFEKLGSELAADLTSQEHG